jgi:hypothetical protein
MVSFPFYLNVLDSNIRHSIYYLITFGHSLYLSVTYISHLQSEIVLFYTFFPLNEAILFDSL